ncbi:Uncharacterized protein PBTT_02415 [Plasmodiophora brassicae]
MAFQRPDGARWPTPASFAAVSPAPSTITDASTQLWTPVPAGKQLSFEEYSPIAPAVPPSPLRPPDAPAAPLPPMPTNDKQLRSSLSVARADLNNAMLQIEHLRRYIVDLERDRAASQHAAPGTPEEFDRELNRLREAIVQLQLERISIEADRDSKAKELLRVRQELDELGVLYRGKDRELRRLQDLHEAQARRDTKERAADDDRIRALAELVTRLRNGLAVTNDMLNNERQRSARFETELDACRELHRQACVSLDQCRSDLLASRNEVDELLAQLSEITAKRKDVVGDGGVRVQQRQPAQSDAVVNDATSTDDHARPARACTPTLSSVPADAGQRRAEPSRASDANGSRATEPSPSRSAGPTGSDIPEPPPDVDELVRELSNERTRVVELTEGLERARQREQQTDRLCDLLQSEIETLKRHMPREPSTSRTGSGTDDSSSGLLDICMDECSKLKDSNAELMQAYERAAAQCTRQAEEIKKMRDLLQASPDRRSRRVTFSPVIERNNSDVSTVAKSCLETPQTVRSDSSRVVSRVWR